MSNASELLPEPDSPVITTSRSRGIENLELLANLPPLEVCRDPRVLPFPEIERAAFVDVEARKQVLVSYRRGEMRAPATGLGERGPDDPPTPTEPMMSTRQPAALEDQRIPVRAKLAAAWTSFMFLYAYVDILNFFTPGVIEDILKNILGVTFTATQASVTFDRNGRASTAGPRTGGFAPSSSAAGLVHGRSGPWRRYAAPVA